MAWFVPWQLTVLVGWDVAALVGRGRVWWPVGAFTPEQTAEFATREDDSRTGTQLLLLGAALASLVGVVLAFVKANEGDPLYELLLDGLRGVHHRVLVGARAHGVRAAVRAPLLHGPRGRDRLQDERPSIPTTATSRTPRSRSA